MYTLRVQSIECHHRGGGGVGGGSDEFVLPGKGRMQGSTKKVN